MSAAVELRTRGALPFSVIFFELFPASLVVALLVAVGVVHVTARVLVVKVGYELSRLDQESVVLTRDNDRLKLELATLRSPSRLENIARSELGMAPAAPGTVVHLNPNAAKPAAPAKKGGSPR